MTSSPTHRTSELWLGDRAGQSSGLGMYNHGEGKSKCQSRLTCSSCCQKHEVSWTRHGAILSKLSHYPNVKEGNNLKGVRGRDISILDVTNQYITYKDIFRRWFFFSNNSSFIAHRLTWFNQNCLDNKTAWKTQQGYTLWLIKRLHYKFYRMNNLSPFSICLSINAVARLKH